jgi:hypothetical protein
MNTENSSRAMRRHDAPARQRLRIVLRWSSVMAWFLAQEVAGQAGDAVTVLGQPPKGPGTHA